MCRISSLLPPRSSLLRLVELITYLQLCEQFILRLAALNGLFTHLSDHSSLPTSGFSVYPFRFVQQLHRRCATAQAMSQAKSASTTSALPIRSLNERPLLQGEPSRCRSRDFRSQLIKHRPAAGLVTVGRGWGAIPKEVVQAGSDLVVPAPCIPGLDGPYEREFSGVQRHKTWHHTSAIQD